MTMTEVLTPDVYIEITLETEKTSNLLWAEKGSTVLSQDDILLTQLHMTFKNLEIPKKGIVN